MQKFTPFTGIAAPLDLVNVDTDMINARQVAKTIGRTGLGVSLFPEMRYDVEGHDSARRASASREAGGGVRPRHRP